LRTLFQIKKQGIKTYISDENVGLNESKKPEVGVGIFEENPHNTPF
jgi:hypothetical protein